MTILLLLSGSIVFWMTVSRPILLIVAIVALAYLNYAQLPPLADFGGASLRLSDLAIGGLVFVVLSHASLSRRATIRRGAMNLMLPLLVFVVYLGGTLAVVGYRTPELLARSAISYLRLAETILLAPLTYAALKRERDLALLGGAIALFAVVSVGLAGLQWSSKLWSSGLAATLGDRYRGLLGENSLGLVSGLLLLYGLITNQMSRRTATRALLVLVGLAGLYLTKSASSILATGGALAIVFAGRRFRWSNLDGIGAVLLAVVLVGASFLAVWVTRPADSIAFLSLTGGSFAHRLMLAYGGVLVFLQHPVLGVGWQASGAEAYIGSPSLNAVLVQAFPNLPPHYFPAASLTSVHNVYIQLLAETGLVGVSILAWGGANVVRAARNVSRGFGHPLSEFSVARQCRASLSPPVPAG